ncbi:MAG: DUF4065 domain-containing protein [Lachnospiraceae bacterium]|nr:DUF4065 domain-containing protein [Lachnospiraceae bacterium]
MIKHFMILSSSYSSGTRIALHYIIDEQMNPEMLTAEVKTIKEACGETVSISTHYVETDSADWESVMEKDAFFEGVVRVDSLVGFVNLISEDRVLKGIDIAKYILSTRVCTHLELEKLVYMCYADYLCATHKKLFKDKIYAFRYGPVIESVYEEYKGMKDIEEGVAVDEHIMDGYAKMPARSRILFAEDGIEKIAHIDATLKCYMGLSAAELVNITHVVGGPWDSVDKDMPYAEISDDIIFEKHIKEVECIK